MGGERGVDDVRRKLGGNQGIRPFDVLTHLPKHFSRRRIPVD